MTVADGVANLDEDLRKCRSTEGKGLKVTFSETERNVGCNTSDHLAEVVPVPKAYQERGYSHAKTRSECLDDCAPSLLRVFATLILYPSTSFNLEK